MRVLIAVIGAVCSLCATAEAWNGTGHMASAAVAYFDLKKRNPIVLTRVVGILKQHPQYVSKWVPMLSRVPDQDRDLHLFMLAACWSDDVRKKYPEYDRPKWHSVKIPYHPGQNKINIPGGENIISAYAKNHSIAGSASANAEARAVALCWIFHLTGDVHQPLHTIRLTNDQFPGPKGDPAGAKSYIRVSPLGKTISLHKLWDHLIKGPDKFQAVRNEALTLMNRPDLRRDALAQRLASNKSFSEWATESYKIAAKRAYREGTLRVGNSKDDGIVLPRHYIKKAKKTAEKQIVLAGYRISDVLTDILGH